MKPRLDGLEVFALPLASVKAEAEAREARKGAAVCPVPAAATSAFCLPGHLVVAEPEALAAEHLLGQAMLTTCAIQTLTSSTAIPRSPGKQTTQARPYTNIAPWYCSPGC